MTKEEFEIKYKDKGGVKMLQSMTSALLPQSVIAKHFEVSKERMRQWMKELFGENYDPRPQRREFAISKMIDFYKNTSREEFKKAFRGSAYYRKALVIIDKKSYEK